MTTDDILRMAREAGWSDLALSMIQGGEDEERLKRFSALATAHEREARQAAQVQVAELQERLNRADAERCAAVLAERDECAKVAKDISDKYAFGHYGNEVDTADEIEAAIRARGKTTPPGQSQENQK